jgi:hypothetical protein
MNAFNDHDHDHKSHEPWQTLGKVRDDLRQIRAHAWHRNWDKVLAHVERALARIGDGSINQGDNQ